MRFKAVLFGLCVMPGCAIAQTLDAEPPAPVISPDRVTVGLAGGIVPSYDGSDNYRLSPGGLLQGQVRGFSFSARGTNFFVDLVREAPQSTVDFVAGPVVQLRLERNSSIRDPQVAALGKIKPAFEVGGYVGIGKSGLLNPFDKLQFDVSYRADVSGIHRSAMTTPTISYITPLSLRTLVLVAASADHVGRKYGQTYFDVPPTATASGLAPYAIDRAGWKSVGGTMLVVQSLSGDLRTGWSVFASAGYSRLLGQYARSPIVADAGSADQFIGFAGVGYTF